MQRRGIGRSLASMLVLAIVIMLILGLFLALRTRWKKTEWGVVTNMTADGATALDSIAP